MKFLSETSPVWILSLALLAVSGCRTERPNAAAVGTTSIQLSGAAGVSFEGYYVRDGRRVPLSSSLPWVFECPGISEFELQKINPRNTIIVQARYDSPSAHTTMTRTLGPGVRGVLIRVDNGFEATNLAP
jgi:hypothetical protein